MEFQAIKIRTEGERFYDITPQVKEALPELLNGAKSGMLFLCCMHTSCALTISENYDPDAREDLEAFLKHLAPRNLKFIKHTDEGPDDSPSHMKSVLLGQSLQLIISDSQCLLGQWQGVFLGEFRDSPKERKVYLKFIQDKV